MIFNGDAREVSSLHETLRQSDNSGASNIYRVCRRIYLPSGGKQLLFRRKFSAVLSEVTAANNGRILVGVRTYKKSLDITATYLSNWNFVLDYWLGN